MKQLFENWRRFLLLEAEGKKVDELAAIYPEYEEQIRGFSQKHFNWLYDRFSEKPKYPEIHPIEDVLPVLVSFAGKEGSISGKWKANKAFKASVEQQFPSSERQWNHPADITKMTSDILNTLVGLSQVKKKKQSVDIAGDKGEIKEEESLGNVNGWNLWMPHSRESSCRIAGFDPETKEPRTTWCTARTQGENLFYNYVARKDEDIVLFYIIKDEPQDPNDWLSVGWVNGKPVLDDKKGALSVNADNEGLTDEGFNKIVGSNTAALLMKKMEEQVSLIGGKHPAKQKLQHAAIDPKEMQSLLAGLGEDATKDAIKQALQYVSLTPDKRPYFPSRQEFSPEIEDVLVAARSPVVKLYLAESILSTEGLAKLARTLNPKDQSRENIKVFQTIAEGPYATNSVVSAETLEYIESLFDMMSEHVLMGTMQGMSANIGASEETLRNIFKRIDRTPIFDRTPGALKGRYSFYQDQNLAINKNTPEDILDYYIEGGSYLSTIIGRRPNLSEKLLLKIIDFVSDPKNGYYTKRRDILGDMARRADISPKIVDILAKDNSYAVRLGIAKNFDRLTPTAAMILSKDPDEEIQNSMTSWHYTPPEGLDYIAKNANSQRTRTYVVSNPNTSFETILTLTKDEDEQVRKAATLELNLRQREMAEKENPVVYESTLKEHFNNWREFIKNS